MAKKPIVILYVKDQEKSKQFYESVLEKPPVLDVPGMTEFEINGNFLLGLMPESSIIKILGDKTPDPSSANGVPRCELYLFVENPLVFLQRAIANGAGLVSEIELRTWGDEAGYCIDPDGHIIAFAS